jgi:hypothetical protein
MKNNHIPCNYKIKIFLPGILWIYAPYFITEKLYCYVLTDEYPVDFSIIKV